MNTKSSLLTALRRYRPGENRDPLENFITEAFAWLLSNYPAFGRFYLEKILGRLGQAPVSAGLNLTWQTQVYLRGVYPDLIATVGDRAYLFEHKAWSPLHVDQLANYRGVAAEQYGEDRYRLILIVGGQHLIDQKPDLALCWREIHGWVGEWLKHPNYQPENLFVDFQRLLESEGMGPPAPVSHESILAYASARSFEASLTALVSRTFHHNWAELLKPLDIRPGPPSYQGLRDGSERRIGINLLGNIWSPGLFIGFLVDPSDHQVDWASPYCPDFGAILDVRITLHRDYEQLAQYVRFRETVRVRVRDRLPTYSFLDHLSQSSRPNRWHPIHVRMPMIDLLRGTLTADEQEQRLRTAISSLARTIMDCPEFMAFREALNAESRMPA